MYKVSILIILTSKKKNATTYFKNPQKKATQLAPLFFLRSRDLF